ncbi:MAG: hypothetical protein ACI8TF_002057, partial [Paracoccaceae bacterium]
PFLTAPTLETPVLVFECLGLGNHGRICYPAGLCKAKAREGMPPYCARHL